MLCLCADPVMPFVLTDLFAHSVSRITDHSMETWVAWVKLL
jgi:hypothetical protein